MSDVSKLTINDSTYDLKDAIARLGTTHFVQGAGSTLGTAGTGTTANHSIWRGTNENIPNELYTGLRVAYKNDKAGVSGAGVTLQLNGGSEHPVVYGTNTTITTRYPVNSMIDLIYDAAQTATVYTNGGSTSIQGCWKVCDYSASDTNSIGYQLRTNTYQRKSTDTNRYYKIFFSSADDTMWVPASSNSTNNATSARAVNPRPINPFGEIVYNSGSGTVSAGANVSATTLWQQYVLTLGYSFNRTGTALTLTTSSPVYVKCTPQSDGGAIMDPDTPIVQSLPTTEDGKIYILLGFATEATKIELLMKHPVYEFKNGKIQLYTGAAEASIQSVVGKTVTLSTSEQAAIQVNGTDSGSIKLPSTNPWANSDKYHTSGSWSGLTYTATANGDAGTLALTIPTGTAGTQVALGNHTHGNISNAGTMTDTAAAPAGNDYILTRDADNAKVQTSTIKATDAADAVSKKHSHTDITLSTTAQAYDGTHTIKLPATSPWGNALAYRGVTTTALSDGATTNPITINGSSYTAVTGDVVLYKPTGSNTEEYIFDGTTWQLFGSVDADDLGDLAFGDTITIPAKYAKLAFSGSDSNLLKANSTPSPSQVLTSASIPANSVVTNGTTTKYILSNATTITGGTTKYLSVKCEDQVLTNPSYQQITTDVMDKDGTVEVLNTATTSYLTGSATGGAVGSASGTVAVLTGASAKRLTASSSNVITAGTTQYFHPSASGGAVGASTETGINAYTSNTPKYKSATTTNVAAQGHTHNVTLNGNASSGVSYISSVSTGSAASTGHTHSVTLTGSTSTSTGAVSYISGVTKNSSALSVTLNGDASSGVSYISSVSTGNAASTGHTHSVTLTGSTSTSTGAVSYISGVTKNSSALSVTLNGDASSGVAYISGVSTGSAASTGHTHAAPTITISEGTNTSNPKYVKEPTFTLISGNNYELDFTYKYMGASSSTIAASSGTVSVVTGGTSKNLSGSIAANSVVTDGTTKYLTGSATASTGTVSVVTGGTSKNLSGSIAANSVVTGGTTKYLTGSATASSGTVSVITGGTSKNLSGSCDATTTAAVAAHTGWSAEGTSGDLMSSITFGTTATAAKTHTHSFTQPTISLSPNGTASGGTAYISGLTSGAPTITLTGTTALITDGVAYVESVDLGSAAAVGHTHSFTQPSVSLSSGSTTSTGAIPYISSVTNTQVASNTHTHDIIATDNGFRVIDGVTESGLTITLNGSTTQTAGSTPYIAELSSGTHTHSFTQNDSGTNFITGITKNGSAIDVSGNKTYTATWASQPTLDRGAASGSITASTGTSTDYTIVFGQEGTYGPDSN